MPDWSIKIVPADQPQPDAPGAFQPDVPKSKQGDPLETLDDDIVTWNNTTPQEHWPWPAGPDYKPLPDDKVPPGSPLYLSDRIPPKKSSRPSYNVLLPDPKAPSGTIYYCCKLHAGEHGRILVTAMPAKLPQPPPAIA